MTNGWPKEINIEECQEELRKGIRDAFGEEGTHVVEAKIAQVERIFPLCEEIYGEDLEVYRHCIQTACYLASWGIDGEHHGSEIPCSTICAALLHHATAGKLNDEHYKDLKLNHVAEILKKRGLLIDKIVETLVKSRMFEHFVLNIAKGCIEEPSQPVEEESDGVMGYGDIKDIDDFWKIISKNNNLKSEILRRALCIRIFNPKEYRPLIRIGRLLVVQGIMHEFVNNIPYDTLQSAFRSRLIIVASYVSRLKFIGKEKFWREDFGSKEKTQIAFVENIYRFFSPFFHFLDNGKIISEFEDLYLSTLAMLKNKPKEKGMAISREDFEKIFEYVTGRIKQQVNDDLIPNPDAEDKTKEEEKKINHDLLIAYTNSIIQARAKHMFSLSKKKDTPSDNFGLRIIYDSDKIPEDKKHKIYHKFAELIFRIWEPSIGGVTDYMAYPKPFGYKAFHIQVSIKMDEILKAYEDYLPEGFEIQIVSIEAHLNNSTGASSHANYKMNERKEQADEVGKIILEYWEKLFTNNAIVFTSYGEPVLIPSFSTPLDVYFLTQRIPGESDIKPPFKHVNLEVKIGREFREQKETFPLLNGYFVRFKFINVAKYLQPDIFSWLHHAMHPYSRVVIILHFLFWRICVQDKKEISDGGEQYNDMVEEFLRDSSDIKNPEKHIGEWLLKVKSDGSNVPEKDILNGMENILRSIGKQILENQAKKLVAKYRNLFTEKNEESALKITNFMFMERVNRRKWDGAQPEEYIRFFLNNVFDPYEEMKYVSYICEKIGRNHFWWTLLHKLLPNLPHPKDTLSSNNVRNVLRNKEDLYLCIAIGGPKFAEVLLNNVISLKAESRYKEYFLEGTSTKIERALDLSMRENIEQEKQQGNVFKGFTNFLIMGCCSPIPGDNLQGIRKKTPQGVEYLEVHLIGCFMCMKDPEYKTHIENLEHSKNTFYRIEPERLKPIILCFDGLDKVGLLNEVSQEFSSRGINIGKVEVREEEIFTTLMVWADVESLDTLEMIVDAVIERNKDVIWKVDRVATCSYKEGTEKKEEKYSIRRFYSHVMHEADGEMLSYALL